MNQYMYEIAVATYQLQAGALQFFAMLLTVAVGTTLLANGLQLIARTCPNVISKHDGFKMMGRAARILTAVAGGVYFIGFLMFLKMVT